MSDARPIGIFDSGVGGLVIAKEIKRLLPNESIIYFGDTQTSFYGEMTKEEIITHSIRAIKFLKENDCKLILVACNSTTINSMKEIKKITGVEIPIIDAISPVADKVSFELREKIGVILNREANSSAVYKKAIRKRNKHIEVVELQTTLLHSIIEEGFANSIISKSALETYLLDKRFEGIDSIILGCNYYTCLEKEIKNILKGKVSVINPTLIIVNQVIYQLTKRNRLASKNIVPKYEFYVSADRKNTLKSAKKFFGKDIQLVEKAL